MAATRDLKITRSDLYTHVVKFKNPDGTPMARTGYSYRAQVRSVAGASDIASFAVDTSQLAKGQITLTLSVAQTGALPSSARWDLEETAPGAAGPVTLIAGAVIVTDDITR